MPDKNQIVYVSQTEMFAIFKRILLKHELSDSKASICANIFTQNSLDGVYTHGVNRFPRFIKYLQNHWINPKTDPSLVATFGGIEIWDGNLGPGPSNALFITEKAMNLASEHGIACIALKNTNHWMRGGYYAWQAAQKGFAFISWTNTISNMPAWGAIDAKLGNNPMVFAVPFRNEAIVLDMSMSQYSFGAMELAVLKGEQLSQNGGFDAKGKLTNNPQEILDSRRPLPIGLWKGSGLALLLDIFAAILSAGLSTHQISEQITEISLSQIFIAIDLKKLSHFEQIQSIIEAIILDYESSLSNEQQAEIIYPGQRVLRNRQINETKGIPVHVSIWDEINSF